MNTQYNTIQIKVIEEDYQKLCHALCTKDVSKITLVVNEAIIIESPLSVVELLVEVDV